MGLSMAAFRGRFSPRTEGRAFLARVARRVEAGFILGRPHSRSGYAVVSQSGDALAIRSQDFWTDFSVGLNDISLRLAGDGGIEYHVTFWRWVRGGVVLCTTMTALFLLLYLLPLPEYLSISAQVNRGSPRERLLNQAVFWGTMVWFGIAWPWVLAALHRRFAEGMLRRILGEVDAAG